MAFFKRVMRSSGFKVAAGAAAGYALGHYSPQLQGKATEARKWVQQKRNSLFPRVSNQASTPAASPAASPAAYAPRYQAAAGGGGGSLLQRILDFLFGRA